MENESSGRGKRTGSEREKTGLAGGRVEERIHGQLSREKLSGKRVMNILGSCLLNLLSGQRMPVLGTH